MAEHHVVALDLAQAERLLILAAVQWDEVDSARNLHQLRRAIRDVREAKAAYEAVRPVRPPL